jgi:N-sulfoglucosamine sulfohydrolase
MARHGGWALVRVFVWLSVLVGASSAAAAPRNIVLFVCDDLSPDLGCYGNTAIRTPHLDQLAAEGVRLRNAFATTASCSASRSVILTGLHNHANAQYGHEHSYHHFRAYDDVRSLPVRLNAAGYHTARIGKLHVGPTEVFAFDQVLAGPDRNAVEMAERCRGLLSSSNDKPFFLYFCPSDPHRSGGSVDGDPLKPNPFGNRPQGYEGVHEVKYRPEQVKVPAFLPDTPVCRAELAQYYQSVSRIDQGVGRLVQILREAGRLDDTLIIFTSDHGIAFPGAKTTVYEPGLRVPMIVRGPVVRRAGSVSDAMVSLVDLVPTLLEFAGAGPAAGQAATKASEGSQGKAKNRNTPNAAKLHGRSFLQAMNEEKPPGWDSIYASHTFHEITMYYPMRVVREGRYKLIWNLASPLPYPFASDLWESPTWQEAFQRGPDAMYGRRTVKAYLQRAPFELYDLEADPDESRNLADDPAQAERLAALKTRLRDFQTRTQDPWALKWNYE